MIYLELVEAYFIQGLMSCTVFMNVLGFVCPSRQSVLPLRLTGREGLKTRGINVKFLPEIIKPSMELKILKKSNDFDQNTYIALKVLFL